MHYVKSAMTELVALEGWQHSGQKNVLLGRIAHFIGFFGDLRAQPKARDVATKSMAVMRTDSTGIRELSLGAVMK